jgi:hypothetical protein
VSGHPPAGTKYRIISLELLVPVGAEMFMEALSDFRDDNPDELVEWTQIPPSPHIGMTKKQAEEEWYRRHNETIEITEIEETE